MPDSDDADANALRGGVAATPFPSRLERGASSINVRDFHPDQDDFEQWVKLFEKAVKLATNVRDIAALRDLFLEWLPLKLHATAYVTYLQATKTTWPALKEELIGLFIDPQERYQWQAKFTTLKWDGKESFHNLAARVVQAVNKYDKEMPDEYKVREYFFRFRNAFKKPMRRIIDMGCPANNRTLEMAKEVALRYQLSTADDDGEATDGDPKGVALASANLHPDHATSIETAIAGITTRLENLSLCAASTTVSTGLIAALTQSRGPSAKEAKEVVTRATRTPIATTEEIATTTIVATMITATLAAMIAAMIAVMCAAMIAATMIAAMRIAAMMIAATTTTATTIAATTTAVGTVIDAMTTATNLATITETPATTMTVAGTIIPIGTTNIRTAKPQMKSRRTQPRMRSLRAPLAIVAEIKIPCETKISPECK